MNATPPALPDRTPEAAATPPARRGRTQTTNGAKGRVSKRMAAATAALAIFATPALASFVIQSYMRADVGVADNCLVTAPGSDVASYNTEFGPFADHEANPMSPNRVTFEEDTLTVRGMRGDRVIYTDVARIRNECQVELRVSLNAAGSQGTGWQYRYAEVYLSSATRPFDTTEYLGYPGDGSANWAAGPISVDGTGLVSASSAPVIVPAGQEVRVATVIEADMNPLAIEGTSTLSWEVTAINLNGN